MSAQIAEDLAPNSAPASAPIMDQAWQAVRMIPPLWPLSASVAVNPYLGQVHEDMAQASARLDRVAGIGCTMPRAWYAARIDRGDIKDSDLQGAIDAQPNKKGVTDVAALKQAAKTPGPKPDPVPSIADLAQAHSQIDWPGVIADRIGHWAAGYFDQGQALWPASRRGGAYASWRAAAECDVTPEIIGLPGFCGHVADAPVTAAQAIERSVAQLGLTPDACASYFHQLLISLGGWAQLARHALWQAELRGESDETLIGLLAARLVWEEKLHRWCGAAIESPWQAARTRHGAPLVATPDQQIDALLQEAVDRAAQRQLSATLREPVSAPASDDRPALQAAFCIDVRSEVFRRALEAVDPGIQTLGFAGFFGLSTAHRRFASDVVEARLPVLLTPGVSSRAGDGGDCDLDARYLARAKRAWGRFKLAAVSSFAFVEASGPVYVAKLLRDSVTAKTTNPADEPMPVLDPLPAQDDLIDAAETILKAMSLTGGFAPLVLVVGHGANVTNNPHASALHCGACGGYAGDVNARLLAGLLNDAAVRKALVARGIEVPADTLFVGALHDTTTDQVTLFDGDGDAKPHAPRIAEAKVWLAAAGTQTRIERALHLPGASGAGDLTARSRDWSQVRPEWALAGCRAFIAAPRTRTAGKALDGEAFLHDYDWRKDDGFSILTLIMTAPVVVASWISLQYYGSTVSPQLFGAGNKLIHNVVGGVGVVEGNGGPLRAGLPWQSVHDGEKFRHEPIRLSVCIEAPREAMSDILEKNPDVRALFDNHWLHLFALDDKGQMAWRYAGDLTWVEEGPLDNTKLR